MSLGKNFIAPSSLVCGKSFILMREWVTPSQDPMDILRSVGYLRHSSLQPLIIKSACDTIKTAEKL
jgi:hypothetical protein